MSDVSDTYNDDNANGAEGKVSEFNANVLGQDTFGAENSHHASPNEAILDQKIELAEDFTQHDYLLNFWLTNQPPSEDPTQSNVDTAKPHESAGAVMDFREKIKVNIESNSTTQLLIQDFSASALMFSMVPLSMLSVSDMNAKLINDENGNLESNKISDITADVSGKLKLLQLDNAQSANFVPVNSSLLTQTVEHLNALKISGIIPLTTGEDTVEVSKVTIESEPVLVENAPDDISTGLTKQVQPSNEAPSGTDKTVSLNEDGSYTFAASDFGFSDVDGDSLTAVTITTIPAAGTLKLGGVDVTAGQSIAVANIPNLVFTPAANANGTGYANFTFQVQDSGGTANSGVDLDPTVNTITIDVNAVNDAPVLDPSKSPTLTAVNEDAAAPSGAVGTLVSGIIDFVSGGSSLNNLTDPDASAVAGIAITGVDSSHGTWYYSIDGGTNWSIVPSVSDTSSLLLTAADRLYFKPNADYFDYTNGVNSPTASTPATVTFRAWDTTSGTAGTQVNTTINGNATAFSILTDTASINVTSVADALFTGAENTINFNLLPGGPSDYTALYDALGGADTVTLPTTQAQVTGWAMTSFTGGAGADYIIGSDAPLTLSGGNSPDTISYENVTGAGVDVLLGGAAAGTAIGLSGSSKSASPDTLSTFENATGSQFDDILRGDSANNILTGLGGNDNLQGFAGNDTLIGGAGDDTYVFTVTGSSLGSDTITENVGGGIDTLDFSGTGTGHSIIINLNAGTEGTSNLNLSGIANLENVYGGASADTITGDAGANILKGFGANDTLSGLGGSDTLIGGAGADTMDAGADLVTDYFRYDLASEGGDGITNDIISNFVSGTDQFLFARSAFTGDNSPQDNVLDSDKFLSGAGLGVSSATAGVYFVYNTNNGQLFYDADSQGGAAGVMIADTNLSGANSLLSSDIHFF